MTLEGRCKGVSRDPLYVWKVEYVAEDANVKVNSSVDILACDIERAKTKAVQAIRRSVGYGTAISFVKVTKEREVKPF